MFPFRWKWRFKHLSWNHAGAGGMRAKTGLICWEECIWNGLIKKFSYQIISEHKGEEAGIKSSTIKVQGDHLYGLMKLESGVHRLVRISPFDSGARRHTSFASVWVYPAVEDDINIKIDDKDLRWTLGSSGLVDSMLIPRTVQLE